MNLIEELQTAFRQRGKPLLGGIEPLTSYHSSGDPREIERGQKLLSQGKVGVIVLAGGQGTRLGWSGPKGTFPFTSMRHKSLFQLLLERQRAASLLYKQPLKVAFMVSPDNESESRSQLPGFDLFVQKTAPFLDDKGVPVEKMGPCGNGEVLQNFYQSGLWQKWKNEGVETIQIVPIDNPLADPFDPNLCGFHSLSGADATLKGILRERSDEKVGVVGVKEGKLRVVEYFELPEEERLAFQGDLLKWRVAHTTLFCFSMNFVEKVKDVLLPWHFAEKNGLYKCERFIFDLLDLAEAPRAIVYPREETYAPIKNAVGENSPETARKALLAFDKRQFKRVSESEPPALFELDPAFYYPIPELIAKWRGRTSDAPYIEP